MFTQMPKTDRSYEKRDRFPQISELSVWRTVGLMVKLFPETCCVVAAEWADAACASGQKYHSLFWGRVKSQLMEFVRPRTSADTVN